MKTRYDDLYEVNELFTCDCNDCYLRVTKFKDEPDVYISKYTSSNPRLRFFDRVGLALGFIFKPNKYDIYGDIILIQSEAKRLARTLLKTSETKPNNFLTGENE